jgi:hypothetical protein
MGNAAIINFTLFFSSSSIMILKTPEVVVATAAALKTPLQNGTSLEYSNTVTITPIPKNQSRSSFPMKSESTGGVEIRMVVPVQETRNNCSLTSTADAIPQETMKLSLEDIIRAGLSKKPRETNYQCTKAFAERFDQPKPVSTPAAAAAAAPKAATTQQNGNRHNSVYIEQGSPGDSDYESAQEGIPFKIRKQATATKVITTVETGKSKTVPPSSVVASTSIDLKIQKSIKDFFQAGTESK